MPKRNVARPRGPEADVAVRVALEREKRGWPAAELVRRMEAAGCPINQSAINKIEQGDPPRRITVDELVAFAQVFGLDLQELLIPAHAAKDHEIARAYSRLAEIQAQVQLLAGVGLDFVDDMSRLTQLDERGPARATRALAAFRSAFIELADALDAVADDVKAGVREGRLPAPAPALETQVRVDRPAIKRAASTAANPSARGRAQGQAAGPRDS